MVVDAPLKRTFLSAVAATSLMAGAFCVLTSLKAGDDVHYTRNLAATGVVPKVIPKNVHVDASHLLFVDKLAAELLHDQSKIWEFEEESDDVKGGKKPVVNTFFHILHGNSLSEANAAIIAVWKHAWFNAGFHPRVLSLTDAEAHADYDGIVSQVEVIPGIGKNKYEQMCFLRYFAMSVSGGGFMADYDTVPLSIVAADHTDGRLPNDGNFTNFSRNPALLSGSAEEWDRVARALVEEGKKKVGNYDTTKKPRFSDMLALFELTDNKEVMWDGSRLPKCGIFEFPTITDPDAVDCRCAGPALHVSHHDSKSAGVPMELRGLAMGEFMNNYHLACSGPAFFSSPEIS